MTALQAQCLLKYLGHDPGPVDGIWGSRSRTAAMRFQQTRGLPPDGTVGATTAQALREAVARAAPDKGEDFWQGLRYFRRSDPYIGCPCPRCGGFPVEPEKALMVTAEKIRVHFGRPLIPSSTIRCQAHNDSLPGSVKNSRHLLGKAMDFSIPGVSVKEVLAYTRQLQEEGQLRYTYEMAGTGHVHIDIM